MDMNTELIHKELSTLQKKFALIDVEDIESKVSNLKQRIFMMNKRMGFDKKEITIKPIDSNSSPTPASIQKQDTREEMSDLRAKLQPKKSIYQEMAQTDKELDDALQKAFAKMK